MKRMTLISASLLLAFAGCTMGQSGKPNFFTRLHDKIHGKDNVGAPCDAGCHGAEVPMPTDCESCGSGYSSNYGEYSEGQIMNSYESTPMSIGSPTTSMTPTYTSPTYVPGPTTSTNREIVNPRPAS